MAQETLRIPNISCGHCVSAIDYANIASNYRDMGNSADAVRYYRLALELDPSIGFARDNLERLTGKDHDKR